MKTGITNTQRQELQRLEDRNYKDMKTGITDIKIKITKTWRQELQRLEDWNYKYLKTGIRKT